MFKKKKKKEKWPGGSQPVVIFQGLDEGQFSLECTMHHGSWQKGEVEVMKVFPLEFWGTGELCVWPVCVGFTLLDTDIRSTFTIFIRGLVEIALKSHVDDMGATAWKDKSLEPLGRVLIQCQDKKSKDDVRFAFRVSSCYVISTWFYLVYISCTVFLSQFTSQDWSLMANQNTLAPSLRALLCLSYPLKFWPFPLLPTATLGSYDTVCLHVPD